MTVSAEQTAGRYIGHGISIIRCSAPAAVAIKIKSGEQLRICMTSDFFLEEADRWRDDAWRIIRQRPDVIFFLLTKRPERVAGCLPSDWGEGWENVFFNVSADLGFDIAPESLHIAEFSEPCQTCGSRPICNGCTRCNRCHAK